MNYVVRFVVCVFVGGGLLVGGALGFPSAMDNPQKGAARVADLVHELMMVSTPTRSQAEYQKALESYRRIQKTLSGVNREDLDLENQVDYDLLDAGLKIRIRELEKIRTYEVNPESYLAVNAASDLLLRPESNPESAIRAAIRELKNLPVILASGKKNLKNPARIWTENALYQAGYAKKFLSDELGQVTVDNAVLKKELMDAAAKAVKDVEDYEAWMKADLMPRSTRTPTWDPQDLEYIQKVGNQLDDYPLAVMLKIGLEEEIKCTEEMTALAKKIHHSGDLKKVWDLMKDDAPPWEGVVPLARNYVDLMTNWLKGPGSHLMTISDRIEYGVAICPPMSRRPLSFGGAYTDSRFPGGRVGGYYVMTPLEDRLTPEEKASRIKGYNPYQVNVTSYHEWLGHIIQLNTFTLRPDKRPIRGDLGEGSGFSQSWSFYLEKLMEDEGFFKTLPYMDELKTRMGRLQMRMWRIQRIITKIKMAKGEMTFEEAVDAYVNKIGMEYGNSYIEVQRDSGYCRPPGSEIIGEMEILKLRDDYKRYMGEHYTIKKFHDTLISLGEIPFKQMRRLIFGE
jgi:uncharacterized protein (DUF885 family)